MATVLLLDMDDRTQASLEQSFKILQEDGKGLSTVTRITDIQKAPDAFVAVVFDVVIVDQSMLTTAGQTPGQWLEAFKKVAPRSKDLPFLATGHDADFAKIFNWIDAGYVDYIIKPVDRPLLVEKIFLFSTGKRDSSAKQLFSLTMSNPADVARRAVIEEISEFDCKIKSSQPYKVGEVITLYSKVFTADMGASGQTGAVLARCYLSGPHDKEKEAFLSKFSYVGISNDSLKYIRTSIRREYVNKKGPS